jgi:hypothetical protein
VVVTHFIGELIDWALGIAFSAVGLTPFTLSPMRIAAVVIARFFSCTLVRTVIALSLTFIRVSTFTLIAMGGLFLKILPYSIPFCRFASLTHALPLSCLMRPLVFRIQTLLL